MLGASMQRGFSAHFIRFSNLTIITSGEEAGEGGTNQTYVSDLRDDIMCDENTHTLQINQVDDSPVFPQGIQ